MASTEFSSSNHDAEDNVTNRSTGSSSDAAPQERGYLHQMSPSVLHMTKKLTALSVSFPDQMLNALGKIIESPMVGVRYHSGNNVYTAISELKMLPRQTLYRFSLPLDYQDNAICSEASFAFLLLDQQLPDFLTAVCFGGSISSLVAEAGGSSSLAAEAGGSYPAFTRIGKQLLDQVANTLTEAWRALCSPYCSMPDTGRSLTQWMGGTLLTPISFTDDCLLNQFDLEFHDPAYADSPWLVPVCFYTPVNAFTSAMVQKTSMIGGKSSSDQHCLNRIVRFLGKIEVNITVDLEPLFLPVNRLFDLKAGDVLLIHHPGKSHIHVENTPLFQGITGQHAGHLTVRINEFQEERKVSE